MEGHELWLAECAKIGYEPQARRYAEGTRTSQDAADQLGCNVAHIAKSIVFAGQEGAVIVITSGSNRVERKRKLKRVLGYKPGMATPEYVLENRSFGWITDKVAGIVEGKMPRWWNVAFVVSFLIMMMGDMFLSEKLLVMVFQL